jgi:excisionase family DNA binding protein
MLETLREIRETAKLYQKVAASYTAEALIHEKYRYWLTHDRLDRPLPKPEQPTKSLEELRFRTDVAHQRLMQIIHDAQTIDHWVLTLTEQEAAEQLGVSKATVYRLRSTGRLGYYRISETIRYAPKHLDEYLRSVEVEPSRRRRPRKM